MKRIAFFIFTYVAAAVMSFAQQPALGVQGVVQMVQAGLSDPLIIERLRQDGRSYVLSTEDMITLKREHVSDNVLRVMLNPNTVVMLPATSLTGMPAPSGATPAPGTALVGDPNDPLAPHDSGIYVASTGGGGKTTMTLLERADYTGARTGGIFASAMTYGIAKIKTKAIIPGEHASIHTDKNPTFYFYFDDKAAGLGKGFGPNHLSNPKQFTLLKLEVSGRNRQTQIMSANIGGMSSGTDDKKVVSFHSEQIRPGLYKVTLEQPIPQGEYAFLASLHVGGAYGAGAAGAVDIFDFSAE